MKSRSVPQIHIIDKSPIYRKVIEELIRALGHSGISSSESCEQLLSLKIQPDIIILDHDLGNHKLTGLDFVRSFGSLQFPNTRFVFLSSTTSLDIAVSSLRAGAKDYIIKSKAGWEHLAKRLDQLVGSFYAFRRKQKQFKVAMFSLVLFGFIFALTILLYNHQMI